MDSRPLRSQQADLTRLAASDLSALWRQVDDATTARMALFDVLPKLITTYGSAAASIASDWYDDVRDSAGVKGNFRAVPADPGDQNAGALIAWATSTATSVDTALPLVTGGAVRRIRNYSRQSIMGSSLTDPQARGWQREGDGESCDFCLMLIERGAVYTEDTADFLSHDNCNCDAVPAF